MHIRKRNNLIALVFGAVILCPVASMATQEGKEVLAIFAAGMIALLIHTLSKPYPAEGAAHDYTTLPDMTHWTQQDRDDFMAKHIAALQQKVS